MEITQNIILDLTRQSVFQYVSAKQGDRSSRFVKITLTNIGVPYKPPAGVVASFRAQKPDGTMILNQAVINADGTVTIELTEQTLAVSGDVIADIFLTDSGGWILSSVSFIIRVGSVPDGTKKDSTSEFLVFMQMVERAEAAVSKSEKAAVRADQAANRAADKLPLAGGKMTGAINMGGMGITNLKTPVSDGDAATKLYVDNTARQLIPKGAFYGNINTVDGGENLHLNSVVWLMANQVANNPYPEYGICETWAATSTILLQRITYRDGVSCYRMFFNSEWQPFIWTNPPMILGKEYKTAQKMDKLNIYTMCYSFGNLPNNTSIEKRHNIPGITRVVGYDAFMTGNASSCLINHPNIESILVNKESITIRSNTNLSPYGARFIITYLKDNNSSLNSANA